MTRASARFPKREHPNVEARPAVFFEGSQFDDKRKDDATHSHPDGLEPEDNCGDSDSHAHERRIAADSQRLDSGAVFTQ